MDTPGRNLLPFFLRALSGASSRSSPTSFSQTLLWYLRNLDDPGDIFAYLAISLPQCIFLPGQASFTVVAADSEKSLILIIGDEPIFIDAVKLILEDQGYEAVVAMTDSPDMGNDNVARFDLAIADIRCSGIPGFEIVTRLRRQYPNSAIVLTIGDNSQEVATRALALGADAVLSKPFSPTALIQVTQEVLSNNSRL